MQAQRLKSILSTVHQRNSIVDSESSSIGTKLAIWNDETEEYLVTGITTTATATSTTTGAIKSDSNESDNNLDDPSSIKETARLLHSTLMVFMANDDPLQVNSLRERERERERSGDKNGDANYGDVHIHDDSKADRVVMSISNAILKPQITIQCDTDTDDDDTNNNHIPKMKVCAQLIRACKNLIRWNRILFMQAKRNTDSSSGSVSVTGSRESYISSAERLCSPGMVSLYANILQQVMCNSVLIQAQAEKQTQTQTQTQIAGMPGKKRRSGSQTQSQSQSQTESQVQQMKDAMDDVARQASIALFHSTFCQAPEPCCKKALVAFVSKLNGIEIMARLLMGNCTCNSGDGDGTSTGTSNVDVDVDVGVGVDTYLDTYQCSVNVMLSLMKNLLNLVYTVNNAMMKLDAAFEKLCAEMQLRPETKTETGGTRSSITSTHHHHHYEINTFTLLVSTLAWALRSGPIPFPPPSTADRRHDLIIEIISVLYALRTNSKNVQKMEVENRDMMTQLGVIIVDILKLPHKDRRCYSCKLSVLQLLMDCPKEYGNFLIVNHAIQDILSIFWFQLNTIVIEGAGDVQSERNATVILPVLVVLNQLVVSHGAIMTQVKDYIFPQEDEKGFMAKVEEYRHTVVSAPENERAGKKNMHPLDAPVGTTRWKLIKLMTWTESNVKRTSSELLWSLCNKDPNQFMLRCGFGNAVHLLGIKGLYKIPKQ